LEITEVQKACEAKVTTFTVKLDLQEQEKNKQYVQLEDLLNQKDE